MSCCEELSCVVYVLAIDVSCCDATVPSLPAGSVLLRVHCFFRLLSL